MSDWSIQTTENGGLLPVTALIQAPSGAFSKLTVETYEVGSPELPASVFTAIQNAGLNCSCVLLLVVDDSGGGATVFHITATESKMLSENPEGIPNGVVTVFDQSNDSCLAVVPTKGGITNESEQF